MEARAIGQGLVKLEFKQHNVDTLLTHLRISTNEVAGLLSNHYIFFACGKKDLLNGASRWGKMSLFTLHPTSYTHND